MSTEIGMIYPYREIDGKRLRTSISSDDSAFKAIIQFNEKVLLRKEKAIMLFSRLDFPPTTLRIVGSGELINIHEDPPLFFRYKRKKGRVSKPDHPQGIVCTGLAQSLKGARKIIGRNLEPPFTDVIDTFGTKGAVIVGVEGQNREIHENDQVVLKELRHFRIH
jgi:hypothetical protein